MRNIKRLDQSILFSQFIKRIKERYLSRYDIDYNPTNLFNMKWLKDQFETLLSEITSYGFSEDTVLYYVDWFFGFKSTKNTQSLGLLFHTNREGKENEILKKFMSWYEDNKNMIYGEDGCFLLALKAREELTYKQREMQNDGRFPEGCNYGNSK